MVMMGWYGPSSRWSSEPLQGKNQHGQIPGKAFFQSGKYVGLSWFRAQSVQYFVGQALLEPCTHPEAGSLLWERTRFAHRCTPKSPGPVDVCEECLRKPGSVFVPACLLQAVQEHNKSRIKADTRLAAIL